MTEITKNPRMRLVVRTAGLVVLSIVLLAATDMSKHSVLLDLIRNHGPQSGPDMITAVTKPNFLAAEAASFLDPVDRVIGIAPEKQQPRAYPLRILNWHEIVDDKIGGVPIVVTWCPLTATPFVFKRTVNGKELNFISSGKVYQSNLLMEDQETESLWSQILGTAVVGAMTGARLDPMPCTLTRWAIWRGYHPDSLVMSERTGFDRDYKSDPYVPYESSDNIEFPVSAVDNRLPTKERVLGIEVGGLDEAFPESRLATAKPPVIAQVGAKKVEIFFDAASGTMGAVIDGKHVPAFEGYWFAWAAFHPQSLVWGEEHRSTQAAPFTPPSRRIARAASPIDQAEVRISDAIQRWIIRFSSATGSPALD